MTKPISSALKIAAFMLVSALTLRYVQHRELLSADAASRMIQVIIGLALAIQGNFMPKNAARFRGCATSRMQSSLRIGGWAMTIAGLAYAGFSAFAPITIAYIASIFVVAAATLVTVAYFGWTCSRTRSI